MALGLSFVVGVIGNVVSVLVFLAPVKTFWRIVRTRSTEEFQSFPYVCTLLSSALWTYYGIIKAGAYLVATVNGFGIVAESVYVILFLVYAPQKSKINTAAMVGALDIGVLAGLILATGLGMKGDIRIDVVGFMCAGLNIVMYGSPLAAMRTVVRTRSVEYMPFFLSFFLLLNGGIWSLYALLVVDYFLLVPNGIGFLLGIAQLVLFAIYRNAKPVNITRNTSTSLEDGLSQGDDNDREPLISPSNYDHQQHPASSSSSGHV
ncbi:hypothetical protein MLD38_016353 [Melastoma candidum]|uniref:Uncharacterized protein n=1 Tax=Melastoma candidum TaxID=119954 RepID=A0ACB9RM86_9MYRT|nr:hypothetical protein MLD38_016353 [Melastoma candidum]